MIVRDVEACAVADLATSPPRASLAVAIDDQVHALPVRVTLENPADPASSPRIVQVPGDRPEFAGGDVVVVADDGPQWFRLRALTIRGEAVALDKDTYRVVPERIVAWDYGSLREVPAPPGVTSPRHTRLPTAEAEDSAPSVRSSNLQAALQNSRVMVLASRSPKGMPFAVPLWFVLHEGRIYAATSASSWTVRNVVRSPQVALLFGGERPGTSDRVLVRGHARAIPGTPPATVLARIATRYYLHPRFAAVEVANIRLWSRRARYYRQSQAAHIVITPHTVTECRI